MFFLMLLYKHLYLIAEHLKMHTENANDHLFVVANLIFSLALTTLLAVSK